jgi:AraC family L-rhamnose operon transcriptional activator RhaR
MDGLEAMLTTPELLSLKSLFPRVGAPIHVNRPQHEGDTPLHQHDFLEIALVVSGKGLHRTIHGTVTVQPGDVFIVRPGAWHAYEKCRHLCLANCTLGTTLISGPLGWLHDDPILGPLLGLTLGDTATVHLPSASVQRCLELLDVILGLQREAPELRRIDLIGQLLLFLGELGRGSVTGLGKLHTPHPAVTQVIALLSADLARNWSLEDLTEHTGLDRSYLVRLLRKHTGMSPMAWLARSRGERAAILLLTTDRTVASIGAEVGWPDGNYFARRFRGLFAQTPSDYRKQLPMKPADIQAEAWIQW